MLNSIVYANRSTSILRLFQYKLICVRIFSFLCTVAVRFFFENGSVEVDVHTNSVFCYLVYEIDQLLK